MLQNYFSHIWANFYVPVLGLCELDFENEYFTLVRTEINIPAQNRMKMKTNKMQ